MSQFTVTQDQITEAFKKAKDCKTATDVLTAIFGEQKPDYSDYRNIKTYEDACNALGTKPMTGLYTYEGGQAMCQSDKADIAYMKLRTIAKALNNDSEFPRFTADEYRYYPYFVLYNQKEINEMSEEKRKGLVLWGGNASHGASCGLASAYSADAWSSSSATFGSRLVVKSSEIAKYFGKQFKELWKDFLIGKE